MSSSTSPPSHLFPNAHLASLFRAEFAENKLHLQLSWMINTHPNMLEGSGNLLSADKVATTQYFQVDHSFSI